jgi:hypothetical protein
MRVSLQAIKVNLQVMIVNVQARIVNLHASTSCPQCAIVRFSG